MGLRTRGEYKEERRAGKAGMKGWDERLGWRAEMKGWDERLGRKTETKDRLSNMPVKWMKVVCWENICSKETVGKNTLTYHFSQ